MGLFISEFQNNDVYQSQKIVFIIANSETLNGGVQGLSVRVHDLRLSGLWFEIHQRHCVMSWSKKLYPLLSTDSTQEMSQHENC